MNRNSRNRRVLLLAALAAALLGGTFSGPAQAQFGGPPGGPGGGPGMRGGPGMGMRGPRPLSAADAPLPALAAGLKLNGAQKAKIGALQQGLRHQRESLFPRPGGRGGPPDFGAMRAGMEKMRGLDQNTAAAIGAVLTGPQRQALPALLRTLDALRAVGLPAETYGSLNLTPSQKTRLAALSQAARPQMRPGGPGGGPPDWQAMRAARAQTAAKAMALLTRPQQAVVTRYQASHPRPNPPGGFGPPPGGFGPPPPGGFVPPPGR